MKAKMKKLISIKSIRILALALLIVSGLALAAGRDPVSISGDTTLTGPDTGVGIAILTIRGETLNASVEITIFNMVISEEGVLHVNEIEHVFDFGEGNTFTTTGKEVADPTETPGLYTLNGYMKIIRGTGAYDGASGELSVHGQIHLGAGWATYESHGAISR